MERKWRTTTIASGVVLVLTLAWGVAQMNARRQTERRLSAGYQERFFEAVAHVENIEVLLAKGMLVLTPEKRSDELSVTVFSDLWRQAFAAQANLTQLPLMQGTLMRTGKFLTQVGDFSYMLARKIGAGERITEEEMGKLAEFRRDAGVINQAMQSAQASASRGSMPWSELESKSDARLRQSSKQVDDNDFVRLEKQASEFPTIIYDGPFSDHILQQKPKGLTGKAISGEQAIKIALEFMSVARGGNLVAEVVGKADGGIPAYQIRMRRTGHSGEIASLDVSQTGGHVVWMLNPRSVEKPTLTLEEAGRAAKDFLVAQGFEHVVPTYANKADGLAIIPFAPLQDGVIIYPDLVKVTVALDDGEIVGFESIGYLMNHHHRQLKKPQITPAQALQSVSRELDVMGEPQLALIPLETLREVLTYEIKGKIGSQVYANYVDVSTGQLTRILQIVDTPEGPRAI